MQAIELVEDGLHIVALSGEVDLHHSPELREVLARHASERRAALLVDFTEVSYIDSAGLATLIEYLQKALKYGGQLALIGVGSRLRPVFELARLNDVFAIHPTVSEARAALGA
jgi:anti-sigma B factor antagonist